MPSCAHHGPPPKAPRAAQLYRAYSRTSPNISPESGIIQAARIRFGSDLESRRGLPLVAYVRVLLVHIDATVAPHLSPNCWRVSPLRWR
jgi:hypothetical protein